MPGTNRKMPKKMRGGGMMAKPKKAPMKKMRGGGGVMAMKKGGAAVRSPLRWLKKS
jgi:hypothetical protein